MVLSVFVLLISLLFSIVNVTGAWFTDSSADKKTINTVIKTGEANLNVYQEDSNGTQTMLSKSLPTGYTQLEYVESTGTQNISTNYVWKNEKTKVYIDATVTTFKAPSTLFGAQYWDDADSHSIWMYCPYDIDGSGNYAVLVGKTSSLGYISVTKNTRFNAEFSTTSDKELTVKFNGTTAVSGTYTGSMVVNSSRGINLFSSSGSGNNQYEIMGGMRCYAFKMWDNDILVRDLVPAKNASGTIGMYDLVEDKFYINQGTGTFTAGAEQIAGTGVSLAYDSSNKTNNKVTLNELPTGYKSINYVTANQGEATTRTASINTGVEWKDVGMLECDVEFTTTPTYNPMLFSSYPTEPYIYAGSAGIVFNGITGTVLSTNYTKSQLTNNGLKYLKLKVDSNTSTKVVSFGCWQDSSWSANWNASSVKIYNTSNALIRDFVACVNGSGTVGMYDLVEGKFYTNAGTFTSGGEGSQNQLKLLLKNEDLGSSFGIRYKVNFYATTLNGKVLLTSSIAGMTAPTSSTNGFVYNSTDGYYYYQNSSGQNVVFEPATSSAVTSRYLMQSFSIDFSSVSNLLGGNSIYMEILVESVTI